MVEAISAGFRRSADLSLLEPYVEKYHAMLVDAWAERSVAIGERVVGGFYPFSLASQQLKDASDAWLADKRRRGARPRAHGRREPRHDRPRAGRAGAGPPRLNHRCGAAPEGQPRTTAFPAPGRSPTDDLTQDLTDNLTENLLRTCDRRLHEPDLCDFLDPRAHPDTEPVSLAGAACEPLDA